MRRFLLFLSVLISAFQLNAQELDCTITINSDKISGSNKQVFETLENALNEFVSQKRWTNLNYKQQERISCNFTLTILEREGNSFKGNIQVQSSRPVYGALYLTPVFNFKDSNFSFQYTEYEPLQFNENSFESNLVSIVSFYAYTIIGMDADTFSLNGGTPYYTQAQNIVVQAQQSGYKGWNQNDGTNTRFTLVDNLLSPTYASYRTAMYKYHLNGLDYFSKDKKKAKASIADAISEIKSIFDNRPNAFLLRVFMDSKSDEIVDVFSDGPYFDKSDLKEILLKMSPINTSKWNNM